METIIELCNIYSRLSKLFDIFYNVFHFFFLILVSEFIYHTRKFITRIYPKAMRADSSNFNPQEFWNVGCQMGMLYRRLCDLQK